MERDIGKVSIELIGKRRMATLIFGETDDVAVLGKTSLEVFGLELDPVRDV